jgi:hypothetical protein
MLWIGAILFRGRARRHLIVAIAFAPMTTSANAQSGASDDIANVPGSFVFVSSFNPLPLPIYGGGQSGSRVGNTIIVPNGGSHIVYTTDFDDHHTFTPTFESAQSNEREGSGAVQVLNIVWLGDSPPVLGAKKSGYRLPRPAEALRMRDWQDSGMDGGALESRASQDDGAVPIFDEASIAQAEESNAVGLVYGLGTLATQQLTSIAAQGSIIGDSYWSGGVENQILGPKAGLVWRSRRGPWSFDLQSSILLGFNSGQVEQSNSLGIDSIPGALNRLLYSGATYSSHSEERHMFTPVGELRAQSRFRLTDALSLRTTWSSLLVENLLNQTGEVHLALPDTTFVVENDNMLIHQIYCGVEYIH